MAFEVPFIQGQLRDFAKHLARVYRREILLRIAVTCKSPGRSARHPGNGLVCSAVAAQKAHATLATESNRVVIRGSDRNALRIGPYKGPLICGLRIVAGCKTKSSQRAI